VKVTNDYIEKYLLEGKPHFTEPLAGKLLFLIGEGHTNNGARDVGIWRKIVQDAELAENSLSDAELVAAPRLDVGKMIVSIYLSRWLKQRTLWVQLWLITKMLVISSSADLSGGEGCLSVNRDVSRICSCHYRELWLIFGFGWRKTENPIKSYPATLFNMKLTILTEYVYDHIIMRTFFI